MRLKTQKYAVGNRLILLFSVIVAILPLLATYASGIPGFSVADVSLAVFAVIAFLKSYSTRINRFTVKPTLIYVALYLICLLSMISLAIQTDAQYVDVLIRIIRYFFYLTVIGFCSTRILDISICKKVIKAVSLLATVYIVLQFLVYAASGVVLKGFLPFLRLYTEGYALRDYSLVYAVDMYRPTSVFLEPAHYARYAAIGVTLFLLDGQRLSLRHIMCAAFVSYGILLSTSSQGYILLALIWFLFIIKRGKKFSSPAVRNAMFVLGLLTPAIIALVFSLPFVQNTLARSLNINFFSQTSAFGARFGGMRSYWELPALYKLIGKGFGAVPNHIWLSSAAYWLYGSGILVFALYLLYGLICLYRLKGSARYVLLIFLLLFFSDDCFYSYMCVIFLSISLLQPIEEPKEHEVQST